jgi:plasmid stabilization system protein ParE
MPAIFCRDGVRIVLERDPLIGRPVHGELSERLISHGRSRYVALYWVDTARSRIEVPALRHPREAGYG